MHMTRVIDDTTQLNDGPNYGLLTFNLQCNGEGAKTILKQPQLLHMTRVIVFIDMIVNNNPTLEK